MRWPATVDAILILSMVLCTGLWSGCGGTKAAREQPDCALAATYRGQLLSGVLVTLKHPLPPAVGRHAVPTGCGIHPGTTPLVERRGIPPTVALFATNQSPSDHGTEFFLATDSFPALADHPLHRYLYGSRGVPNTTRGRRCRATRVDGAIDYVSSQGITIRSRAATRAIVFEERTKLSGPQRDGVVHLRKGGRIAGSALRCGTRRTLVADELTAA